ncbi:DoxX family membrane protein [Saccharospirillum sp. HFRX-1]|uniref:DoxX family protein n=1 Tax=unclassified Saccharospirillum TaxID=2633430 RepID=UPI00371A1744
MNKKLQQWHQLLSRLPDSLIAFVGRFSMAAVFWLSGQTKIDGLAINLISGDFQLGWPHLSDTAIFLFQEEYALPLLAPTTAALLAALAEHLLPILLLFGLATRYAAMGLLAMTLVIQIFVYPGAYATHGVWACVLLYLMAHGAGKFSIDYWLARRLNG